MASERILNSPKILQQGHVLFNDYYMSFKQHWGLLGASFANVDCFASTSVYPFNATYSHDITEISLKLESATRNRRTSLYPALFIRKSLEDTKGVIKAESKSKKDIQYNG